MSIPKKFRAWDGEKEEWKNYMEFFAVAVEGGFEINPQDNITLMQYTGLTDKNGVEIYEGDIVKVDESYAGVSTKWHIKPVMKVEWVKATGFHPFNHDASIAENIEVIGNIYENPELLD